MDPGIIRPSQTIAAHASKILDGIKADTDYISRTTNSEVWIFLHRAHSICHLSILQTSSLRLRRLSEDSMLIWEEIESLAQSAPADLLHIWHHLEKYKEYVRYALCVMQSVTQIPLAA